MITAVGQQWKRRRRASSLRQQKPSVRLTCLSELVSPKPQCSTMSRPLGANADESPPGTPLWRSLELNCFTLVSW